MIFGVELLPLKIPQKPQPQFKLKSHFTVPRVGVNRLDPTPSQYLARAGSVWAARLQMDGHDPVAVGSSSPGLLLASLTGGARSPVVFLAARPRARQRLRRPSRPHLLPRQRLPRTSALFKPHWPLPFSLFPFSLGAQPRGRHFPPRPQAVSRRSGHLR